MSLAVPIFFEERSKFIVVPKTRERENPSYVNKLLSVINLPAFEVDVVWRGASEIVKEFLFNLDSPLSFLRIVQPSDPNFVACIAWKPTSATIVRYKLWNNVGEILYVPLYSGQSIGANFSIEIWNTRPDDSGSLLLEGGGELLLVDGGSLLLSGSLIGIEETITYEGAALFITSKMTIPTKPYCRTDNINIGENYSVCTDMTFDFGDYTGTIEDDFIPFDGDYYEVVGDCGITELIKGARLIGEFKLQSSDDTWHRVFAAEFAGEKHLWIEQDNTTPGIEPFFYLRSFTDLLGYKVFMTKESGEHTLRFSDTGQADFDYTVLYLPIGAEHFGLRIGNYLGSLSLHWSQNGVTI